MKKLILFLIIGIFIAGCSHEEYDKTPGELTRFISRYWPDPNIESCTNPGGDKWVVIIKNGPTLTFDSKYEWTQINGNGMPLPDIVMYDQLPEPLYAYLVSGSFIGQVFSISRTPRLYTVKVLKFTITYDTEDGTIRQMSDI